MRNKTIIAVRGAANQGKSATIKIAYSLLKEKYPTAKIEEVFIGIDITVIITIGGVKVGIESQGDPNSRIFESLKLFVRVGCDVILCATRTRGATVEAVKALAGKFQINWYSKQGVSTAPKHAAANRSDAQEIVVAIEAAIGSA